VNRIMLRLSTVLAVCALWSSTPSAQPDAWPSRPVRLVVPASPGGGTDIVTRQLAEKLSQSQGWAFVVDNRPGGGGNIGLDQVARARSDGYTLGMGQTANMVINPAAMTRMPFDARKDLVPVALVAQLPMILVVRPESGIVSMPDLVARARARPGQLRQAIGPGTVGHIAGELLARRAGYEVLNVPYKGASPALNDLLGGHTDFMFTSPQAAVGLIRGGKLKALAVTSAQRSAILPDTPTVAELGYPGFEAWDWKGLVAPAGTPLEVMQRLNRAVEKVLADPAFVAQLAVEGSQPVGGDLSKAAAWLDAQQQEWGTIIKQAGIRLD
jgi:tripartite-type tricarboxylate transporter receptor subunit TctC